MLDIKQIASFYPKSLRPFKKNILREYLQHKILEAVFNSPAANYLSFIGGTAIHIIHGSHRFSEDLDFDNLSLNPDGFNKLVSQIKKSMSRQGYHIESRVVIKNAFRAYLKFPEVLYRNKITRHKQEKLSIQIDMEPQNYHYSPDQFILNKFDVFQRINAAPIDLLLSQKILCVFMRPRIIGRDFYDIIFLLGKTQPDFSYLQDKIHIRNGKELKSRLREKCKDADFDRLAKDISPFLYNPDEADKIKMFPEFINQVDIE